MKINVISSNDTGETCTIYLWSDNEKIWWGNETGDIIKRLIESFLTNYQKKKQF